MAPGKLCSIEGCDKPVKASGLCWKHYMRVWRHGDPADRPRHYEWLEEHMEHDGIGCLLWPFSRDLVRGITYKGTDS